MIIKSYTLENNPEQYRILYLRNSDIVEKDEDLEEFNNTTHYKVSIDDLKNYNKCGFSIVAPTNDTDNGFFDGIFFLKTIQRSRSISSPCGSTTSFWLRRVG